MRLCIVVAVADNGVIGAEGKMPWHLPADLRHFREVTMGHPVIMGRKTFQSIGRPLPGRQNIVITRDAAFAADGVSVVHSLEEAIAVAKGAEEAMVIGGAEIYAQALPLADRIVMTEIHVLPEGDTFFPAFDMGEWKENGRDEHPASENGHPAHAFVNLVRQRGPESENRNI